MKKARKLERKPLSFSTTMRNPMRIASFMKVITGFEGMVLDNQVIYSIIREVLREKIYSTLPEKRNEEFNNILQNPELKFTDDQLEKIIEISIQNHKEAGFDRGWPSRFDTWYKLPKEFGFLFYKMGEKIEISDLGHMLVKTLEMPIEEATKSIQNIFLNTLAKYQTNNPFRRNLIDNAPFILFLKTVKILKEEYKWEKTGIYRNEIPFITCWPNSNAEGLAKYINDFRFKYGKLPSEEIVYEKCMELLESKNSTRFKFEQIVKEGVDDFIRKLRITGLISLRGMGRLVDINKFEEDKASYLIKNYSTYKTFEDEYEYYLYAGKIDHNIVNIVSNETSFNISDIRQKTLNNWANNTEQKVIDEELAHLSKRNELSKHELLKYIDAPTRFEFLTSIALKQQFPHIKVIPNYSIDDEGMPTFTARGGVGDIEVFDKYNDVLVEVTLMQNKNQAVNEIPGITRHLEEFGDHKNKSVYALFIAPILHPDTLYMIDFSMFNRKQEINGYTITEFIRALRSSSEISDLRLME